MIDAEVKKSVFSFLKFAGCFLSLWIALYLIYILLPFTRPGDRVIYSAKVEAVKRKIEFPQEAKYRVLVFGDSKVLSGFIPSVFDSGVSGGAFSYNAGLPDEKRFLFLLKYFIDQNTIPTHVFLTSSWSTANEEAKTDTMEYFFPFRSLFRNLAIFFLRSFSHGGAASYYRYGMHAQSKMLEDRGYFFIEGQSHYPGDSLPDKFSLATDKPDEVRVREVKTEGPVFKELLALIDRYGIQCYLLPDFYRQNQFSTPPALNKDVAAILGSYSHIHVAGPDYFLFHNRYFSDVNHLNHNGAVQYTTKLRELFAANILKDDMPGYNVNKSKIE